MQPARLRSLMEALCAGGGGGGGTGWPSSSLLSMYKDGVGHLMTFSSLGHFVARVHSW